MEGVKCKNAPRWTLRDSLIVVQVMKKKVSRAKTMAFFRDLGLNRSFDEVRQHWNKIKSKYDLVRRWETRKGASYFETDASVKSQHSLPMKFNQKIYDAMRSKGFPRRMLQEEASTTRKEEGQEVSNEQNEVTSVQLKAEEDGEKSSILIQVNSRPGVRLLKNEDVVVFDNPLRAVSASSVKKEMHSDSAPGDNDSEAEIDGIAFADGCLRFEEDNVADGYLKSEVTEQDKAGPDEDPPKTPKHIQLVKDTTNKALQASEVYQLEAQFWKAQKVQLDQQRMELLMKADAAFALAVNQLAFAVQRLVEKLH